MSLNRSALFTVLLAGAVNAQQTPVALQLEQLHTGLTRICDISHCGDDRLFLTLQAGIIRIRDGAGTLLPTPFIDITNRVNDAGNEQGLLGLAFDPNYATNGLFYLHYTGGTGNGSSVVARYQVSSDPNVADPATEDTLFTWPQPYSNHNGGDLDFGPDGYLYVAFGDGGSGGDPQNNAQDLSDPLGDIIRIDVSDPDTTYTIPPSNPLVDMISPVDTMPEIWASGLRNPYRIGFDSETGDFWTGDVGQNAVEEVDYWPAGDNTHPNFGWRCYEGNNAYNTAGCLGAGAYVAPVTAHPQANQGWCSVIGGRVYRGDVFWRIEGRFIYTDYCGGQFYSLEQDEFGAWVRTQLLSSGTFGFSVIAEGNDGELYAGNNSNGRLYRIKELCTAQPPTLLVTDATLSSSDAISYQWYNDGTIVSGETAQVFTPSVAGYYSVLATVNTGCQLFSDTVWFSPVGLGVEHPSGMEMQIRPNPADDRVWVDSELPAESRLLLIDAQGRIIADQRVAATGPASMDLAGVAEGAYVLRAVARDGSPLGQLSITVKH
jgi:glucose/arabinose dehydrogenase